jgi:DUF3043 family protein
VFRRRTSDDNETIVVDPDSDAQGEDDDARRAYTAAKGRPTPKRSAAEKRRRQPYTAPGDRKAAGTAGRDQSRADRQRKLEAMRRGEDWALPRKDQGPVKGLARDVVDSRRGLSEYYLYAIVLLVVLLFVPALRGKPIVDYVILLILVVIVAEGWWVGRKVVALASERYPGQSTRGVKMYAALRGTQIRRMRVPAPRVNRGDKV